MHASIRRLARCYKLFWIDERVRALENRLHALEHTTSFDLATLQTQTGHLLSCAEVQPELADEYRLWKDSNPIPAEQLARTAEVQAGAIAFAASARELGAGCGLQPFAPSAVGARWTAATLGRLLLLPDDDEVALLGNLQHDVHLGAA